MTKKDKKKPALDHDSSFGRRLFAYSQERFPLLGHGLLIVSYFSSNQFLARVLENPDQPVQYDLGSLLGAITLLCVFFHLRVFDEHKDYDDDLLHFPERILQRGLVTLKDLRVLAAIAIAIELICSAISGLATLIACLIVLGFSLLMLKEFFVGAWLNRHFLLYALSHMLIMPLMALLIYGFATRQYFWQAPPLFWLYAFVGFFVTLNWEISRKIRAPDDEIKGVTTYSQLFGPMGAAIAVLVVRVIDTAMVAYVGYRLRLSRLFYILLILLYAVCVAGFLQFRTAPSPKTAKRLETYAGMYIIAFDIILALEIARKYGIKHFWS